MLKMNSATKDLLLIFSFGDNADSHQYGRKADPWLLLRMTRVRFSGLRHSLLAGEV